MSKQTTSFIFTDQSGDTLKGKNGWRESIRDANIGSVVWVNIQRFTCNNENLPKRFKIMILKNE
jgi:hypothetical protein